MTHYPARFSIKNGVSQKPEGWISLMEAQRMSLTSRKKLIEAIHASEIPATMGCYGDTLVQEWVIDPDGLMEWAKKQKD